ncbi:DUF4936 family protein [Massilia sp. Se16.2.3]|uniref:DUF4936 family protein n=1 Tax=Massilia sp. Se16.2.3 TaxID=2709303 RepID=UPI0015FFF91D|nr:DUF4936 family protein [Massilia sp. Se16.2.3]QNA99927.1 DUF4936 family protein [Massilia sp. Se16.2.3]
MIDLYVYYKVRDEDAARLAPLVRAFPAAAAADVAGRQLMRRPGSKDGLQTWMEVYPGVLQSFAARLEAAAVADGFGGLIAGPRRAEVFMELTTCA